ncbi:class I SAM-dependent methyltransferase [Kiloniella sp. b19]|uniref:class I SAM-dependent methyltransferase n=1 Tax=Kiloniella sp. GXU_MW_B19 TaxID=3141326 RepID=UPI0031D99664
MSQATEKQPFFAGLPEEALENVTAYEDLPLEHWYDHPDMFFFEEPVNAVDYLRDTVGVSLRKKLPDGGKILQLGCGVGLCAVALAQLGYEVTGFDSNAQAIELARQFNRDFEQSVTFHHGKFLEDADTEALELYDAVLCIEDALTWWLSEEEQQAVVKKMNSLLKKNGEVILEVQDFNKVMKDSSFDRVEGFGSLVNRAEGPCAALLRHRWYGSPRQKIFKKTYYRIASDSKLWFYSLIMFSFHESRF